jgi:hypothetical protein
MNSRLVVSFLDTNKEQQIPLLPNTKSSFCSRKVRLLMGLSCTLLPLVSFGNYVCFRDFTNNEISGLEIGMCSILTGIDLSILGSACVLGVCVSKIKKLFPHIHRHQGSIRDSLRSYNTVFEVVDNSANAIALVNTCIDSLKEQNLLDVWLKVKGYKNAKEALGPSIKELQKGLCKGHVIALVNLMRYEHNASSEDLLKKLKAEEVVFFQFWHDAIFAIRWDKDGRERFTKEVTSTFDLTKFRPDTKEYNQALLNMTSLDFVLFYYLNKCKRFLINTESTFFYQNDDIFEITSNPRDLKEYINTTLENFNKDVESGHGFGFSKTLKREDGSRYAIAGSIDFELSNEISNDKLKEEEDEKEVAQLKKRNKYSHSLFFQFRERAYRFNDFGSKFPGFYEFHTQDEFFEGLLKHIQSRGYKYGFLQVNALKILTAGIGISVQ